MSDEEIRCTQCGLAYIEHMERVNRSQTKHAFTPPPDQEIRCTHGKTGPHREYLSLMGGELWEDCPGPTGVDQRSDERKSERSNESATTRYAPCSTCSARSCER
jgi:hypothetical protein